MARSGAASTPDDVKLLRDEIARLLTRNLDLARQLEDLKRERSQTPLETLAAAMAQSMRSAQAALAAEAGPNVPYAISEIDATFRGIVVATPASVALRLPIPEYGALPGHLGAVRMTMAAVPPPAGSPAPTVTLPPSPGSRMVTALETLQAAMGRWSLPRGATAARDLVTRATHLLAVPEQWDHPDSVAAAAQGFATTLRRLAKAVEARKGASRTGPHKYQEAAGWLIDVARAVKTNQAVSPDALVAIAAAAEHASRVNPADK